MATSTPFDIQFDSTSGSSFRVVSFRGTEELSRPYRFDVRVATTEDADDVFASTMLQKRASLSLANDVAARAVHGILSAIELEGDYLHGERSYHIRIVPQLALLKRSKTSRIFQDMSVVDIAKTILDGQHIATRWSIAADYRKRAYCVQYAETDYAFLARLFAQEGLFYWFDHPAPQASVQAEVLVISDSAQFYLPIDGDDALYSRHDAGMTPRDDQVFGFRMRRQARSRAAMVRGYDFRRPELDLRDTRVAPTRHESLAEDGAPQGRRPLSPAEAALLASSDVAAQTRYDHEGAYEETPAEPTAAVIALESERADVALGEGESGCRRLMPGRRFSLRDHSPTSLNDSYVVVRLEHEGYSPDVLPEGRKPYANRFSCAPATARMRRRPRSRKLQVVETAVVVGPAGQEIHTDATGRIKVQFHWDLAGKRDDQSSCWIRTSQGMAGSGFGFQFIPRVGMEVLVAFIGGDVDRPVVTGCLYNATHPLPFPLPDKLTQSGIKTQTSPGGGGFNEILFDDAKGGELLSLRAERDLVETTVRDHRVEVGGAQRTVVADLREAKILGDDTLVVNGAQVVRVLGGASLSVGGGGISAYAGNRQSAIAGDDETRIEGDQTSIVAGGSRLLIGQGQSEGHGLVSVNGCYRVGAAQEASFGAMKSLTLQCGASSIILLPDEIKLQAPKITVTAASGLSCAGGQNTMKMGDTVEIKGDEIRLFSKDASIVLDDDAKVDGKMVKLNCDPTRPTPESEDDGPPETGTITFRADPKFKSDDGVPLTLVIATPTGETIERTADAAGEVKLEGKKGDHFVLIDVRKGTQSLTKKPS